MTEFTIADQIDMTGIDYWPAPVGSPYGTLNIEVVDGEPLVLIRNSKGDEYCETIENLWALRSQIVYENGVFTETARGIFTLRASRGNTLISEIWSKAGYKNIKRAMRETKVLREFAPMLITEKLNVARQTLKPKIEFVIKDFKCYWVLHVNGLDAPIKQADWNDDKELAALATLALDSAYCLTWSALENPNKLAEINEAKALKERQAQVYKFFQNAFFTSEQKEIYEFFSNYQQGIENAAQQIFPRLLVDEKQRLSYVYASMTMLDKGIFNPKTKGSYSPIVKELNSSINGTYARSLTLTQEDITNLAKFIEQEAVLWNTLNAEIKSHDKFILIERSKPVAQNASSLPLRSWVIVKDQDAYSQYLLCEGKPEKLYEMVVQKTKEANGNQK